MISIVSSQASAVMPFVALRENTPTEPGLFTAWQQIDGLKSPRFFPFEGKQKLRMATVLTAAQLALQTDREAVVVLHAEGEGAELDRPMQQALSSAVAVARTGKNVQLVRPRAAAVCQTPETGKSIQGVAQAFFVDPRAETGMEQFEPTGLVVLRADRFLIEAAILCPVLYTLVSDTVLQGYSEVLHTDTDVVALTRQSFDQAFWCKTENRAIVTLSQLEDAILPEVPHHDVDFEPLALVAVNRH
jgi:hypothetical protein